MNDYLITYKDGSTATLSHFGIMGMKWGIRRYQNPDGSLTAEGRRRYGIKTRERFTYSEVKAMEKKRKKRLQQVKKMREAKAEKEKIRKDLEKQIKRDQNNKKTEAARKVSQLSDDELRKIITRLDLEKRYNELTYKQEPTKVDSLIKNLDKLSKITQSGAKIIVAAGQIKQGAKNLKGDN